MFKKILSLLSLPVLTVTPMVVVSCSNKFSYNLNENDMSLITKISQELSDFSIKKETLLKDIFGELDKQKALIFNKFQEEINGQYTDKEYTEKKKEFNKLDISIVYFNKEYDVVRDESGHGWSYYKKSYNKNSEQFKQGNWSEWLELSINNFSVARTGKKWKTDKYSEISKNMLIVLGDIKISHDKEQLKNAWIDGIKVNTKFE
ncbi:hypothetical protein [Spiroplasma endosymbiont of Atherix ibis]|uniref:hypothetical protein n=1 Tax=Spiroplasma endosymbiont of Atherix ibis TaxID=3066291 RepID=UPI0030D569EC